MSYSVAPGMGVGRQGEVYRICICGHPERAHTLLSNPKYTSCMMSGVRCECEGGFRPVVEAHGLAMNFFKRTARGNERPHALPGGVARARERGSVVVWVEALRCDFCKAEVESESELSVFALDERGGPMFSEAEVPAGMDRPIRVDTGHHALLCGGCVSAQREIAILEVEAKQRAEDALFQAALGGNSDLIREAGDGGLLL